MWVRLPPFAYINSGGFAPALRSLAIALFTFCSVACGSATTPTTPTIITVTPLASLSIASATITGSVANGQYSYAIDVRVTSTSVAPLSVIIISTTLWAAGSQFLTSFANDLPFPVPIAPGSTTALPTQRLGYGAALPSASQLLLLITYIDGSMHAGQTSVTLDVPPVGASTR